MNNRDMKKGVVYFLGIITGSVLTILISILLTGRGINKGISYYDEPGETVLFRSVTVFQALVPGTALVKETGYSSAKDQIYLLQLKDKRALYDGETVKAPIGTVFRVVGVYSYVSREGIERTVPVIIIMDRN